MENKKVIISGGGTGGHIFPAISIANALREKDPNIKILFVGALGRMEMERVPLAGYEIVGLPVRGFDRKNLLKNIKILYHLVQSMRKARQIIKTYKPDIAVGVGGYASGPVLRAAASYGIPTLIQEQNSYAGVTNKLLSAKASKICVAYNGMERFFTKEKILLTGNPVRQDLLKNEDLYHKAIKEFDLDPKKKTLLIVGGSLGARTINESVIAFIDLLENSRNIQVIWQTGKYYYKDIIERTKGKNLNNIKILEFVQKMDLAYSVADLVVSRAGAGSISEFCLLRKPVILVPSPNVAEDHQTRNALALVHENAAVMIRDSEAKSMLITEAINLINQSEKLNILSENIYKLAQHDSAGRIAEEILKLIK